MSKHSLPAPEESANRLIARRVVGLRKARSLSFDALAARSELSKGILVAIEQGNANPSIATLCKLARGLRVSVTDLLAQDAPEACALQLVAPDQANRLWSGKHGGHATLLVGTGGPDMLELWDWTLCPGEEFESRGHPAGTVELLAVAEGALELEIDGSVHRIGTNHRAIAEADRPHTYRCHGRKRTRFSMVVHEPGKPNGNKGDKGK